MDSLGAVCLKVANFSAVMGKYQMLIWDRMTQFVDLVPEVLIIEVQRFGKQQLNAASHGGDCLSRAMNSGRMIES